MNKDETLALWGRCEAARKAARQAGEDADAAAKAVWNAWAEVLVAEKENLTAAGTWETDAAVDFSAHEFKDDARFDGFMFPGRAGFGEVMFSGDAGFREATFSGDAGFGEAMFSGGRGVQSI